jgi:hypothetical protein
VIAVVENLRQDNVTRSNGPNNGNYKLKKGIARISDIVVFDKSCLGEHVRAADVLAPAVKTVHAVKDVIFGWQARHRNLIGSDDLLLE